MLVQAGWLSVAEVSALSLEEFVDDAEAIKAVRLFPNVMQEFGGLGVSAGSTHTRSYPCRIELLATQDCC